MSGHDPEQQERLLQARARSVQAQQHLVEQLQGGGHATEAARLRETGADVRFLPADLGKVDEAVGLIDRALARFGRVTSLVNAAASTARPMARRRRSAMVSPISMKPTGNSPVPWQGRLMPQRSRKLPTAVLRKSSRFFLIKTSVASTSAMVGATIAQVGMITAS